MSPLSPMRSEPASVSNWVQANFCRCRRPRQDEAERQPDIYKPQELAAFFGACKTEEHLRYTTLHEAPGRWRQAGISKGPVVIFQSGAIAVTGVKAV